MFTKLINPKTFWAVIAALVVFSLVSNYMIRRKVDAKTGEVKSSFVGFNGLKQLAG